MALENVVRGARSATEALNTAKTAAVEMGAASRSAAEEARSAASDATKAMGEVAKSAADAAKNGKEVIAEFVSQTLTATEQWRQETGTLVNITMEETIANLKEGGGDIEASVAAMLETVLEGGGTINEVRGIIREMGAEALAVFEKLPIHELQVGLDDVNGTMGAMLEKIAEFRAKALGLVGEVTQGAGQASQDVAHVAQDTKEVVESATRDMGKAFDELQDKGTGALQKVSTELQAVAVDFETGAVNDLVDELERGYRGP